MLHCSKALSGHGWRAGWGLVVALAAVATWGSSPAGAVVGGSASADAVDVAFDVNVGPLVISATGGTVQVDDPATNGTNASGPSASVVGDATVTASTSVVNAAATRGPSSLSASSDVDSTAVTLFGEGVVTAGVISSDVECPLVGTPTASASAVGVSIGGGPAVTLSSSGTTSTSGTAAVNDALFVDGTATVNVTATTTASTGGASAAATGLRITLSFASGVLVAGGDLAGVSIGTVVLADTACDEPTGPDPVPSAPVSILPTAGPTAGGTSTTITGSGFIGATGVTFDGAAGTGFTVVDDTTITVTSPAGAAGPADVVVIDPDGNGALPAGFTYIPPSPSTPLSITPTSGSTLGGTPTTITGSGFLGATGVTFDGAAGTDFVVVDDTTITVTTPAGAVGPADVIISDPGGNGSLPAGFTYIAPAAALSITPNSGPTVGGTPTTISGSGFTGATGVTFDGAAGTAFVVVDDTTITVTTPAGALGPADVVITDPAGNGSLPAAFTYVDPAVPLSIVPDEGPTTGGTTTTITGSGFTGATGVTFDGAAGTAFTVVNDTTITVTTPPGALGPADVVVIDAAGNGTLTDGFTYRPVGSSTILSLDPPTGPTTGGTPVTITGFGFAEAVGVTFDGAAGTAFTVVNDTTITVTTPPGTVGPSDVIVNDPAGDGTLPAGFTYTAPAAPTSITPDEGPTTGGVATTITGTGFTGATAVTFDGAPGTAFTVVDDATITVTTPAGVAGPADVVVVDADGNGSLPAAFTYLAPAAVTAISPVSGPTTGGTTATITGSGFLGVSGVTFDGVAGTGLVIVDDATITVTTPPGAVGPADVVVIDASGNGSLPAGFSYVVASRPTSINPAAGPTTGGTTTTITGTGFDGATGVTFDGVSGTGFVVVNDSTITVTTPLGQLGPADVVVVEPGGDGTLPSGFTFTAVGVGAAAPVSSSPSEGSTTGGTPTTIRGAGFVGATGVTFDGVAGTGFVVVDDTTISVTSPPGTVGPADIIVIDPDGSGILPAGFRYLAPSVPTSVTPATSLTGGGTRVTIRGAGFIGATGVTFDGVAGTDFIVVDDTTITVTTPPGAPGPADIVVLDPAGNGGLVGGVSYIAPPPGATAGLPRTGTTTWTTAVAATLSLLTGIALLKISRRRGPDPVWRTSRMRGRRPGRFVSPARPAGGRGA